MTGDSLREGIYVIGLDCQFRPCFVDILIHDRLAFIGNGVPAGSVLQEVNDRSGEELGTGEKLQCSNFQFDVAVRGASASRNGTASGSRSKAIGSCPAGARPWLITRMSMGVISLIVFST